MQKCVKNIFMFGPGVICLGLCSVVLKYLYKVTRRMPGEVFKPSSQFRGSNKLLGFDGLGVPTQEKRVECLLSLGRLVNKSSPIQFCEGGFHCGLRRKDFQVNRGVE